MVRCIWCERELTVYPLGTIPYVARKEVVICFRCVKHLTAIVADQERRHPEDMEQYAEQPLAGDGAQPAIKTVG
jgi:hypothetical protein